MSNVNKTPVPENLKSLIKEFLQTNPPVWVDNSKEKYYDCNNCNSTSSPTRVSA